MEQKNKKYTEEELKRLELEKASEEEREREEILMQADETKDMTFDFDMDGQMVLKSEIADMMLEEIEDPEAKHDLYYNGIQRLLRRHLPKGEQHKRARDLIYEEKNTYMTRGHRVDDKGIRGADSRMTYIEDMHEMVNIVAEWVVSRGTMYDLYIKLRDLNVSKGYGVGRIMNN